MADPAVASLTGVRRRWRLWLAGTCTAALTVGAGVSINQVVKDGRVSWGWLVAALVLVGSGVASGGWAATRERPLALAQPHGVADLEVSALSIRPREIAADAEPLVDRVALLRRLRRDLRRTPSLILVYGLQGAGKTALVARACLTTRWRHTGELRWFDCRRPGDLDLRSLAGTLVVLSRGSAAGRALRAALARPSSGDPAWLAQVVMDYLSARRTILVVDSYHHVRDAGLAELVRLAQRSVMRSTVLLISRQRVEEVHAHPRVASHLVSGIEPDVAPEFLRRWGILAAPEVAHRIWAVADGLPQAMLVLAGWRRGDLTLDGLRGIPGRTDDLTTWLEPLYAELTPREQAVAKLVAFLHAPAEPELIRAADPDPHGVDDVLAALCQRLVLTRTGTAYRMHALVRDHVDRHLSDAERAVFATGVAGYYRARARELLLGVIEQPSYGALYLEAHPDYLADTARHRRLVDDLMARLAELGLRPAAGQRVLVLGSGSGVHDAALAAYGLRITNVDILPEVAALGRSAARGLDADIGYVVADMTRPLPFPDGSMDAVFLIGSSFGYEGEDADNAAVFRHAARALRPGRPLVFEYVNGDSWYDRDPVHSETLPTGAVRTKYRIGDPVARTALDVISLRRPGQDEPEWFHHFMHYYPIETVERMMRAAGLSVVRAYGADGGRVGGEPFDPGSSDSMVVVATSP